MPKYTLRTDNSGRPILQEEPFTIQDTLELFHKDQFGRLVQKSLDEYLAERGVRPMLGDADKR
jgi:hypothetical protein